MRGRCFVEYHACNILIIDDLVSNLVKISRLLTRNGYHVRPVLTVTQALQAIEKKQPDLILLDITMPEMSGFEFCLRIKDNVLTKNIPIIFITADSSVKYKRMAYEFGATDYITRPFDREELLAKIKLYLSLYTNQESIRKHNEHYRILLQQQQEITEARSESVFEALQEIMNYYPYEDTDHMKRVGENAGILANALQLTDRYKAQIDDNFIQNIKWAAPLHDIGKLLVEDSIMSKKGRLTQLENEQLRQHPILGNNMIYDLWIKDTQNSVLAMIRMVVKYHHEKYNGQGYPYGIANREIPLAARIVSVVDCYDMIKSHTYEDLSALNYEAVSYIKSQQGQSFDPDIVEVFCKVVNRFIS